MPESPPSGLAEAGTAPSAVNGAPTPPPEPEPPTAQLAPATTQDAPKSASTVPRNPTAKDGGDSDGSGSMSSDFLDPGGRGEQQKTRHPVPATRRPRPADMIPGVRRCRWEDFINRFAEDQPVHAVDVLIASDEIRRDMLNEASRRTESQLFQPTDYEKQSRINKIYTNKERIQRVKVHSPILLRVFSRVTGYAWGDHSYTFMRPFQYLICFHDKFRDELLQLEEAATAAGQATDATGVVSDDVLAARHLRAYIDFAEAEILPDYRRFRASEDDDRPPPGRIRFEDLWYLMQPGDLIYLPEKTVKRFLADNVGSKVRCCSTLLHESTMQQNIWRLYNAFIPYAQYTATVDTEESRRIYTAYLYHLDYDGVAYGPSSYEFEISHFEGEKDIRELDFYPLRYANRAREVLDESRRIGSLFTKCIAQWHMSYDGWTLITDPVGKPMTEYGGAKGERQVRPQHIDSEVIVDFVEAINTDPRFNTRAELETWSGPASLSETVNAPDLVAVWSDRSRSKLLSASREIIVGADDIEQHEGNRYAQQDKYIDHNRDPKRIPEGDDLALLPRRVFVYSLKDAKFVPVDVRYMRPLETKDNGFDRLQLPESHKRMIQSATAAHIRRKRIERLIKNGGSSHRLITQDFIQGKGRGLILMLHGEPGIGKTATAEAAAQTFRRPLFPISCGNLGGVWAAEQKLDEIFRLADLWDCILLLDEADVLLSARTPTDNLERNGLVSIFLRKLEYYNGILFLTTNRIGKIDQAISSRIHLILHYSRLGRREIESVFRINIDRLKQAERQQAEASGQRPLVVVESDILKFATDHCNAHPKGKGAWNGRQIRNAFVVAAALAREESEHQPEEVQPQLRYSHFKQVETVMGDFVEFRASVLGKDDSQLALLNEERDDDYEGATWVAAAAAAAAAADDDDRRDQGGLGGHVLATGPPRGGPPPTPTPTVYSSPGAPPRPRMTFIPAQQQQQQQHHHQHQHRHYAAEAVAVGYHTMAPYDTHGPPPMLAPQRQPQPQPQSQSQSQSQGGGPWVDMLYGSPRS